MMMMMMMMIIIIIIIIIIKFGSVFVNSDTWYHIAVDTAVAALRDGDKL